MYQPELLTAIMREILALALLALALAAGITAGASLLVQPAQTDCGSRNC